MIVRQAGEELWLFDQNDHAALCGVMAAAWGAEPFSSAPPPIPEAAAWHDNGWKEWDVLPRLDPSSGHPHPYSRMPPDDYLAIWERGLQRAWREGEATGLMISLHAMRFFGSKTRPQDRALFARERAREAGALAQLGAVSTDPEALPEPYATCHAWFFFWDGLSLFLCERWKSPWSSRIPASNGGERELRVERTKDSGLGAEVVIDPFPFRDPLRLEAPVRIIPARYYATQEALDTAVRAAGRRTARWRLTPLA